MKIAIEERGGKKWKAFHLTLRAELRGERWQARLRERFKKIKVRRLGKATNNTVL